MNWYKIAIKKVAIAQMQEKIKNKIREKWPDKGDEIIDRMNENDWNELYNEINQTPTNNSTPRGFVQTPLNHESTLGKIDQFFLNIENTQFNNKVVNEFISGVKNLMGKDIGKEFTGEPINRI